MIYEGSLEYFQIFPLGTIPYRGRETLTFEVELPYETGNEVQGKSTSFAFDFTAVGHEEQVPIVGQCFEPPFANRKFTLHTKSTVPIKFHLRDSHRKLEKEVLNNVRLEVSGFSSSVADVNYIFTPRNGKLDFR